VDLRFVCSDCGREYDPASFAWRCDCGGLLDLAPYAVSLPLERIRARPATLWRYREALPFAADSTAPEAVTLGEGLTPLVPFGPEQPDALLKVEYLMPTLSFKDRGAAVLVARARELGATRLVADSSGNAGTAIAAYAARAGLACDVYAPASASPKKLRQIAGYGAAVHPVPGSREDTQAAAIAAVERDRAYYASHVYNPFFYEGTKTYAYELWEQLGGQAPATLVLPVGNGTLVLGAYYGFHDLRRLGLIDRLPRIVAVQVEACAPLARAFAAGAAAATPVANAGTAAEGIAIAAPARHRQLLAAVRATGGTILAVPEAAIAPARAALAARGYDVEPTAAVPWAGYLAAPRGLTAAGPVAIPLCGAGLKAS
jgi:threonine synthase